LGFTSPRTLAAGSREFTLLPGQTDRLITAAADIRLSCEPLRRSQLRKGVKIRKAPRAPRCQSRSALYRAVAAQHATSYRFVPNPIKILSALSSASSQLFHAFHAFLQRGTCAESSTAAAADWVPRECQSWFGEGEFSGRPIFPTPRTALVGKLSARFLCLEEEVTFDKQTWDRRTPTSFLSIRALRYD